MEGWKVRLKVEYSQLESRVSRLQLAIFKAKNEVTMLSKDDVDLLELQLGHMENYLQVLRKRCVKYGVEI